MEVVRLVDFQPSALKLKTCKSKEMDLKSLWSQFIRLIPSERQVFLLLYFNRIKSISPHDQHCPAPTILRNLDRSGHVVMWLVLVKSLLFRLFEWALLALLDWDHDGQLLAVPAACFIPGRYATHEVIRNELAACISGSVLLFNNMQRLLKRRHTLTALNFMRQPDQQIEDFYRQHQTELLVKDPLAHAMCYRIEACSSSTLFEDQYKLDSRRLSLRLRPNRTRDSRRQLRASLAKATCLVAAGFLATQLVALVLSTLFIMTDFHHLHAYKDCDPALGRQIQSDAGHKWYWVTNLTPYRLAMSLADMLENYSMLTFPYLYFSYASTLLYLLSEDLKIYLRFLQERLELVCHKTRRLICANRTRSGLRTGTLDPFPLFLSYLSNNWRAPPSRNSFSGGQKLAEWGALAANRDLDEIRAQVRDFFHEFDRVSLALSDIISFGFIAWVLSLVVVYGKAIRYNALHPTYLQEALGISLPKLVAVVVPVVFIPSSLLCFMLFQLYSASLNTYRGLSSFVALSQKSSPRERAKFQREITENYSGLQRNTFKVFQTYPFKPMSFFSFIGWTISALAVMFSLVGRPAP